jgi:hypothetical protein
MTIRNCDGIATLSRWRAKLFAIPARSDERRLWQQISRLKSVQSSHDWHAPTNCELPIGAIYRALPIEHLAD